MVIKAITFRKDGFYGQPFAFGGEDGPDKFDPNVRYRGVLTNYLIDTGDEVILVDTGLPAGTPEEVPDEKSPEDMSTTCASRSISPNAGLPSGAQARSAAHPPRGMPISRRSDAHAAAAAWRNIELMATDTAHQRTPCSMSARKAGQKPSTPIPASVDGA